MDVLETDIVVSSTLQEVNGIHESKIKLLNLLRGHEVKREDYPNVFVYGRQHFDRFDQVKIITIDDEVEKKLDGVTHEYSRVKEFLADPQQRGLFVAGFDVVLTKKPPREKVEAGVDLNLIRIMEEAVMIHEVAHASAKNVEMQKINEVEEATKFGLQWLPEGQDPKGIDSWRGTLLEEGFAHYHYGNYITQHYSSDVTGAIRTFLGDGYIHEGRDQGKSVTLVRRVGEEVPTTQTMEMDLDMLMVDGKRMVISPPAYAGMVYRHLMKNVPDFESKVKVARESGDGKEFWVGISGFLKKDGIDAQSALYRDLFNSGNSFKDVAFACLNIFEGIDHKIGAKVVQVD